MASGDQVYACNVAIKRSDVARNGDLSSGNVSQTVTFDSQATAIEVAAGYTLQLPSSLTVLFQFESQSQGEPYFDKVLLDPKKKYRLILKEV